MFCYDTDQCPPGLYEKRPRRLAAARRPAGRQCVSCARPEACSVAKYYSAGYDLCTLRITAHTHSYGKIFCRTLRQNIMQAVNAPFRARRTALACATFDRQSGPHHENPSCHILAESDMCHGKKSRSKILKVPCQVYISGSWVPKVPRQVYISGSWVPKVPRPVYISGSRVPKVPRQEYISGSWVPKVP